MQTYMARVVEAGRAPSWAGLQGNRAPRCGAPARARHHGGWRSKTTRALAREGLWRIQRRQGSEVGLRRGETAELRGRAPGQAEARTARCGAGWRVAQAGMARWRWKFGQPAGVAGKKNAP